MDFGFHKPYQFLNVPNVIRKPRFHRRRNAQCFLHAAERLANSCGTAGKSHFESMFFLIPSG